jgi:Fungal specific transcription factor domain
MMGLTTCKLPGSHFDYLPGIVQEYSQVSKCIMAAATATAVTNLARDRLDGQLMHASRKLYIHALRHVNTALKSHEVLYDSTLVAVLLLTLFESIIFEETSFESWFAHTKGIVSLLMFRGENLLKSDFGKKVYIQISHQLRANCSLTASLLPSALLELDKKMAPHIDENMNPLIPYWPVLIQDLMYKSRRPEVYRPMDTLQLAVEQDAEQLRLMELKTKPLMAPYGLSFYEKPSDTFSDIAQKPRIVALIRIVNTLHQLRLVRCELMSRLTISIQNSQLDDFTNTTEAWANFQKSLVKIARASADAILMMLPFYLNPNPKDPEAALKVTSVSSLVFPLSAFAKCRLITSEQLDCAREAVQQIGRRAKMPVAVTIGNNFKPNSFSYEQLHLLLLA